ncbi:MAG: bifunctional [glutamine synthetase] adenylyltransferase/[glutamine synthetase]-adenylyl-L-tyrosine phosphorylase [Nocardioidaceae bacterium]
MRSEVSTRASSPGSRLARLGFRDVARSLRHLQSVAVEAGELPDNLVSALAASADPDLAAAAFAELAAATGRTALVSRLTGAPRQLERLAAVLGASEALGSFLCRHPELVEELADPTLDDQRPTAEQLRIGMQQAVAAAERDPGDALRVDYRRRLLRLAARDLTQQWPVDEAGAALADLAAATVDGALSIARDALGESAGSCRLAVIGLGKTGGRELNYVSDVDVVFVHEPAPGASDDAAAKVATALASRLIGICSTHTAEGTIWPVDAGLRPEGRAGPLVRTLASHVAYYRSWAKTWEFQALLKARPIAGDPELGRAYCDAIAPMVWRAAEREGFVAEVQAMRRRVVEHIPTVELDRQLKLGPGGLRDVEFAVQLLQLVHGRVDESLRSPTTLVALEALTAGGYVGRDDGRSLADAYRFLRALEHRIQLFRLRRSQLVPDDDAALRRLGRSLGFSAQAEVQLTEAWRAHRREVRRLHEKIFYRPLLAAVAALPGEGLRLTPEAARERLTALGYADPRGALAHLQALTSGVTRRAAIQRQLLPAMLGWFADGPDPDGGLLAFRGLSESLGSSHWYLRQLRDESAAAQQLARVLGVSRYASDMIARAPDVVAMFGKAEELVPRTREQLVHEMSAAAGRQPDPAAAVRAVRSIRRRELCRIAVTDVLGELPDAATAAAALTDLTVATLSAALAAAVGVVESAQGCALPTRMAVVTMGRLGGHEMGYASDADVLFVHVPHAGVPEETATAAATAVAQGLRRMLTVPGDDPPLVVDADLRPEGRQGPLVRTLASYSSYYSSWSSVWEAQALLRADADVGDPEVCAQFLAVINPLRWPVGGVSGAEETEIRRVKARVDAERLPRGADPATHLKLGRGALADVEWTVQLLQMRHAGRVRSLRTTETMAALRAAVEAGLVAQVDAEALSAAWRSASRLRDAVLLVRGAAADAVPSAARDRAGMAYLLGYGTSGGEAMVDDHLRATRRARAVVDRLFWQ